ncbi:hypothetical protein PHSY_000435 [Pseudozyma hubeiensis SY62]|uniref:HPP transmembrane region domain-containing protein n=1 Tax=Pseudozyma hubeiensis (strain SY62) TaxID=1305764 RepID=R9NWN1_PSEHS|nr:hypothetical protein PHSY_000435 [Pseudozyma hubeiensis SY62]GAC92877.1 hypothetical protein PHSY_000435 [Pseudozyma hubeiensis SY62]
MPVVDETGSGAELSSVNAPTTIPEEPTPVSPASPPIPLESEETDAAQQVNQTTQQQTKQPVGRFIENISTDGSRASAEDDADAEPKQVVAASQDTPETQMRQARSIKPASNVLRRGSKKKTAQSDRIDTTASTSQPTQPTHGHDQYVSPSTEGSTQKASPHPNDLSSPSDESGHHNRAFKKVKGGGSDAQEDAKQEDDNDHDHDDEEHPILAALYPLTNFIGYRPLSHPHTPSERRRTPKHPKFNRFHYICGCIFSLGLPVSGDTGEIARYRDPHTGEIELVRMYKHQVGAKIVNSIHSVIAAWVLIALLSLVSRSPFHRAHDAPLIIGAFATEAVVTFFAFRTPLAQPKNILFGNTISAVMGVAMEKAFAGTNYSVSGVYGIDWIAAATAVSAAVFAMQIFGFTHPPGAAIALLAITDQRTHDLDWWLVPVVIISTLIVIGWALIINNVGGRRYPENWFYMNAFAEPPIIGPEKLPFSNSPRYAAAAAAAAAAANGIVDVSNRTRCGGCSGRTACTVGIDAQRNINDSSCTTTSRFYLCRTCSPGGQVQDDRNRRDADLSKQLEEQQEKQKVDRRSRQREQKTLDWVRLNEQDPSRSSGAVARSGVGSRYLENELPAVDDM